MSEQSPTPDNPSANQASELARELQEIKPAATELMEEEIEEMAYDDPRMIANANVIKELREKGRHEDADKLVTENKNLHSSIVSELKESRGLASPEETAAANEKARTEKLKEISASLTGEETPEQLARAFGLIGEDGTVKIDSPLIHESTRTAFDKYMTLVGQTEAMARVANEYGIRIKGFAVADKDRSDLHDMTAKMLSADLGLDFQEARSMAAKIRDTRFPGTSEEALYGAKARAAVKKLEEYNGDVGAYVHDQKTRIEKIVEHLESRN